MTKKVTQNKEFRTVLAHGSGASEAIAMQKIKPLSHLLDIPGNALGSLGARLEQRSRVLAAVQRALPPKLAERVISAGLELGRLTIGVSGAVWASRLRYQTGALRKSVAEELRTAILTVRIRVVVGAACSLKPPRPARMKSARPSSSRT
jgi:hypothetical protein